MAMIRDKPVHLTTEVYRMLWLLAKAEPRPETERDSKPYSMSEGIQMATPDEIADQLLRQAIREQYPRLLEYQAAQKQLEKDIITEIRNKQSERKPQENP
jgi:hypothetical protein